MYDSLLLCRMVCYEDVVGIFVRDKEMYVHTHEALWFLHFYLHVYYHSISISLSFSPHGSCSGKRVVYVDCQNPMALTNAFDRCLDMHLAHTQRLSHTCTCLGSQSRPQFDNHPKTQKRNYFFFLCLKFIDWPRQHVIACTCSSSICFRSCSCFLHLRRQQERSQAKWRCFQALLLLRAALRDDAQHRRT